MKIALVHDSLTEFGGAEKFLQEMLKIFPQTDVFTSRYKKNVLKKHFPNLGNNFHVSWFQKFPRQTTTIIQFLAPLIWKFNSLKRFDLIITSSSFCLSPLATINSGKTIHYIHTLPKNLFGLEKKSLWQNRLNFSYQKRLYLQSLKKGHLIVNSKNMQQKVKEKTGLISIVIYPPVEIPKKLPKEEKKKYFLIISRIDDTKSLEIAIKTCNRLNLPLKIAGATNNPSYLEKLKKMAGSTIEFLGFVSELEKEKLYAQAIAFIFCSKDEDFGIAPVEAMAYGIPVIAYFGGGAKETIIEGKTGLFFYKNNWQELAKTIKKLKKMKFNQKVLYQQAKKFSQERFKKEFISYTNKLY